MAATRINLGKVVPEKGVDYFTDAEIAEFKADIEEDVAALEQTVGEQGQTIILLGQTQESQGQAITTLQTDSGHTIEMTLDSTTYVLTLVLKNKSGTVLATQSVNLPSEDAIVNISYSAGKIIATKQSGDLIQVDISDIISGLVTESTFNTFVSAIKEVIGIDTDTYNSTSTYNTGDIVIKNEKIYKAKENNITGTFDNTKWDEISVYEYQKIQDEKLTENYNEINMLKSDITDLQDNQLIGEEIGTSIYIDDCAGIKNKSIKIIGNSTQNGTPTPSNLVNIKHTGDEGNIYERIENKNLFNIQNLVYQDGKILNDSGTEVGDSAGGYTKMHIPVNPSTKYTIGGLTESGTKRFYFFDKDENFISRTSGFQGTYGTTTTPSNCYYIDIQYYKNGNDFTAYQLEQGSIVTSYIAHQEQNITFPLSTGQKLMQGDYLADNGIHHVRSQTILDGSEDENYSYSSGTKSFSLLKDIGMKATNIQETGHILSNYYEEYGFNSLVSGDDNGIARYNSTTTYPYEKIVIKNINITTVSDLKTWLSTHNLLIEYELEEEVIEPYTSEQQIVWNQIKTFKPYKLVTNINSSNETPPTIDIVYIKDINTLETRIEILESQI